MTASRTDESITHSLTLCFSPSFVDQLLQEVATFRICFPDLLLRGVDDRHHFLVRPAWLRGLCLGCLQGGAQHKAVHRTAFARGRSADDGVLLRSGAYAQRLAR